MDLNFTKEQENFQIEVRSFLNENLEHRGGGFIKQEVIQRFITSDSVRLNNKLERGSK